MRKIKTKMKWKISIIVFLVFITAIRLTWIDFAGSFNYSKESEFKQGVLDLRGWEFSSKKTLALNGEWEFYPSLLIPPEEFKTNEEILDGKKRNFKLPQAWDESFSPQDQNFFRYGTYRLRILLDDDQTQSFGLRVEEIRNASEVFVNGKLVGNSGKTSTNLKHYQARNPPYTVEATPNNNEIDVVIHVSNHTIRGEGGITKPIRFGTIKAVNQYTSLSIGLQLLLCGVFLFHSLYAIILYFLGMKNKSLYYFSLLILCAIFSVLVADDRLLFSWIDLSFEWERNISSLSYIGVAAYLPLVLSNLFSSYSNKKIIFWFKVLCGLYVFIVLLLPYLYVEMIIRLLLISVFVLSITISIYILVKAIMQKENVIFLLLASLSIGINILWTTIENHTPLDMIHYPFDLIIAILAFSAFWFQRFLQTTEETKHLANKLQLEIKRKDEFLVNTSHELRNPLHVISNITHTVLNDRVSIHEKHKERLEVMSSISGRMSIMLNDLVDITRLKENNIQLNYTSLEVQSVINGVVDMVSFMLENKPIQLHIKMSDKLPAVHADENRIIQVLFNLVHNAVKYTEQGTITIRCKTLDKLVQIDVEDTGIGIEENDINRILLPYEQASKHSSQIGGGFGLGLSISKQLIEMHDGTLTVRSIPGKGSVFSFTLPTSEDFVYGEEEQPLLISNDPVNHIAATTDSPNLSDRESTKINPKVLAVDDDNVNLKVLIDILEQDGYSITAVTSAEQAITYLEKIRFDIVISDVMMPKISGYELTKRIRERFNISELPVLLLTARTSSEDILTGFQVGANDYVQKPVDAFELKARVRALTDIKLSIEERIRMEGAWLQSQIQPHFLLNTLNSIAALGMSDYSKMQALLEEFSNYLRYSFDFKNSDPVVPLEDELALVQSYLYIEKERFGERLQVEWEVDTGIDEYLPPLSIQPIVENAVKHGVFERQKGGKICIQIKRYSEFIEISVHDNGKGMTKEIQDAVITENNFDKESKGIGLRNINRRMNQLYGRGITIHSNNEQGTVVSFQIPKNKE
ncbi:ATP-binding protein [Ornithinibacillus salinisoli]|uniref:histidine kinase n=1 Tax=Ornithinibacillus salinisoli TaxID=1848459 RepID=A0ABW4W534_9BACI